MIGISNLNPDALFLCWPHSTTEYGSAEVAVLDSSLIVFTLWVPGWVENRDTIPNPRVLVARVAWT
jgi:hypothetical protein